MTWERTGEGPIISSAEAKMRLGRSSCVRGKGHMGGISRDPEHKALSAIQSRSPMEPREIREILARNPQETVALRAGGLSDKAIAKGLKRRGL